MCREQTQAKTYVQGKQKSKAMETCRSVLFI